MYFCLLLVLLVSICSPLEAQTPRITLEPLLSGLSQPVFLANAHDGSGRRYIVEQTGRIRVLEPGATASTVFLDITSLVLFGGEQGLLGLAFHPQFSMNQRFYVNYTRRPDGATVVSEYRAGVLLRELFTIPQPYENHNGGMIEFGPDGFLYIGMGDGGSGNDPQNRAQNPNELLGKMLRIDVNIPGSLPGIFASGLRNPWRFSFDRLTGQLYAGDVGQNAREEIDVITQGGNYGWRVWEGTRCTGLGPGCSTAGYIFPIVEYATGPGGRCSIIGGYVYRGTQASLPFGAYVYGDFCSGEIFMLKAGVQTLLADTLLQISSFGEDEAGEIYVTSLSGSVFRLVNPDAINSAQRSYAITDSTAFVASTAGSASALTAGYGRIQAGTGQSLPSGLAIFGYQQGGVLVSEASVPATRAVTSGRVFAEVESDVNTGIAFANPNNQSATVAFYFTDRNGSNFGNGTLTIPPNRQIAAFLNEAPFSGGNSIFGAFTFTSSIAIAATALRGLRNERGDFLMTTLPVVDIGTTPQGSTVMPYFVEGGGWTTQVILLNPSDVSISGTLQFVNQTGRVLRTTPYAIPSRSSTRVATAGLSQNREAGSVRVSSSAAAVSIFSFKSAGITVSQAGVPTLPAAVAFRMYVEAGAAIRSGIAIANPSDTAVDVTLEVAGLTAILPIAANGQTAVFLNEIAEFAALPFFQGVLRITSATAVAVTGLRGHTNERGDFLITTLTPTDESAPTAGSELFVPHFADGSGYNMQIILFGRSASGTMYFFDQAGNPASLLFR